MKPTRGRSGPRWSALGVILVSVAWQSAAAQPPNDKHVPPPVRLRAELSAAQVQVAEPLQLTVVAEAPDGVSLQWPPTAETLGSWNVRGVEELREIPISGGRQSIRVYRLDSYESGQLQIPPIRLTYTDERPPSAGAGAGIAERAPADRRSGTTGSVQTAPLVVTVTSALEGQADPARFREIRGVVDLPDEPSPAWGPLAAGAAATMLAAAGFVLVRRYRGRPAHPAQTALQALDRLQQQAAGEDVGGSSLVAQVTGVLRRYIEQRFQIAAPRLTTREFLEHAREADVFDASQQRQLAEFLNLADLVKFAGVRPDSAQAVQSIHQARQFVLQTRQQQTRPATRVAKEHR